MSQITVKEVIPKDSVSDVRPETPNERRLRIFGEAAIRVCSVSVAVAGFILLLWVFLTENPKYEKYRDNAWPVMLTIIGAAVGVAFSNKKP